MQKNYDITEENLQVILRVKESHRFTTERAAINYILEQHEKQTVNITDEEGYLQRILHEMEKQYHDLFVKILASLRKTELGVQNLRDGMNTLLQEEGIDGCILADIMPSPVLEASTDFYQQKIKQEKLKKDAMR